MTPEKALAILEGKIPHKEIFHQADHDKPVEKRETDSKFIEKPAETKLIQKPAVNTEKPAPEGQKPALEGTAAHPKSSKTLLFVLVFSVFMLSLFIAVYLLGPMMMQGGHYKREVNEDPVPASSPDGRGRQITQLQADLTKSNNNVTRLQEEIAGIKKDLESETRQKAELEHSLKEAPKPAPMPVQASMPVPVKPPLPKRPQSNPPPAPAPGQSIPDQRISAYDQAIRLNPYDVSAYINRGLAYEDRHRYDPALSDLTKAIGIAPGSLQAYIARGIAYEAKGDYTQALRDFNKAIRINPRYSLCFYRRGDVYYLKGNYSQALSNWTRAIKMDSQNPSSGITYYQEGKHDRVISDNSKVIRVYPDYTIAYYRRGAAYAAKGRHDQAIRDFSQAIALNPNYKEAYANRAIAYFLKHDYSKAWQDVKKAQSLGGAVNADFINSLKTALGKDDGG